MQVPIPWDCRCQRENVLLRQSVSDWGFLRPHGGRGQALLGAPERQEVRVQCGGVHMGLGRIPTSSYGDFGIGLGLGLGLGLKLHRVGI